MPRSGSSRSGFSAASTLFAIELLRRAGVVVRHRHIRGDARLDRRTKRRRSPPSCSRGWWSRCRRRTARRRAASSSQRSSCDHSVIVSYRRSTGRERRGRRAPETSNRCSGNVERPRAAHRVVCSRRLTCAAFVCGASPPFRQPGVLDRAAAAGAQLVARVELARAARCPARSASGPRSSAAARDPCGWSRACATAPASASPARRFSPTLPSISPRARSARRACRTGSSSFAAVFGPDLLDARNVVRAVADEREVVDDLLRDRRRTWP